MNRLSAARLRTDGRGPLRAPRHARALHRLVEPARGRTVSSRIVCRGRMQTIIFMLGLLLSRRCLTVACPSSARRRLESWPSRTHGMRTTTSRGSPPGTTGTPMLFIQVRLRFSAPERQHLKVCDLGGDDLKLKAWDVRQGFDSPVFVNKRSIFSVVYT